MALILSGGSVISKSELSNAGRTACMYSWTHIPLWYVSPLTANRSHMYSGYYFSTKIREGAKNLQKNRMRLLRKKCPLTAHERWHSNNRKHMSIK